MNDKQVDDKNEWGRTIQWGRPSIRGGSEKIQGKYSERELL